jgi:hypothetical protein
MQPTTRLGSWGMLKDLRDSILDMIASIFYEDITGILTISSRTEHEKPLAGGLTVGVEHGLIIPKIYAGLAQKAVVAMIAGHYYCCVVDKFRWALRSFQMDFLVRKAFHRMAK